MGLDGELTNCYLQVDYSLKAYDSYDLRDNFTPNKAGQQIVYGLEKLGLRNTLFLISLFIFLSAKAN